MNATRFTKLPKPGQVRFRTSAEVRPLLRRVCAKHRDLAEYLELGTSEAGRPIPAVRLGTGPAHVSLVAGAHSDEPVGPETLRTLIPAALRQRDEIEELLTTFTFFIVPHINPDGEAHNRRWIRRWPDLASYLLHAFREPPGRDLEFGFPDMRQENRLVARFLQAHAPFGLHMSLHGMGVCDGGMLLIEKTWVAHTGRLREEYAARLAAAGLRLHDHDRKGEKGFRYIGPGFTTTPEGRAMRAYFQARGDEKTAGRFHASSMEFVRSLGGDPLCLVTELPLFVIDKEVPHPPAGVPVAYLEFKRALPHIRARLAAGEDADDLLRDFRIRALDPQLAVRLQFDALALGLMAVTGR